MLRGSVRLFAALLVVALLYALDTPQTPSAHAHGCAPLAPPLVAGSPEPALATPRIILINEVLSLPKSSWYCTSTYGIAFAPWVELYNPQNHALDLYSVHASFDTGPNSRAYYLPLGATIAANGFLVLFPTIYTNMLVAGTTLRLLIGGVAVDQIVLPTLGLDQSYARVPDGASTWQITSAPTIDASNTSSGIVPTPLSSSSQTGSGGSSYTTTAQGPAKIVNGVQPKWGTLRLPSPIIANSNPTTTPSQTLSSPAISSPTSSGMDVPHLLLMGLLAVALAGVLFWCWRLFARS
jgi:hypothetical protein